MTERAFPVLWQGNREYTKLLSKLGCPTEVPWDFVALHAKWCKKNHDQTPERLAERGGLSPEEMVAIIQHTKLSDMGRDPTKSVWALKLALVKWAAPIDFKPSQVRMWRAALPLIDTFGHAETEFAAALMVLACVRQGDEWQPVIPQQMGKAMEEAAKPGGCLEHLKTNPFTPHPDLRRLSEDGFAVFLGGDPDDVPAPPIRFTKLGLETLRQTLPEAAP